MAPGIVPPIGNGAGDTVAPAICSGSGVGDGQRKTELDRLLGLGPSPLQVVGNIDPGSTGMEEPVRRPPKPPSLADRFYRHALRPTPAADVVHDRGCGA